MGTSTDGLVWWGVAFNDEEDKLNEIVYGDPDADETAELYGDGREWLTEHGLMGKVEFIEHCSGECPMWGIALPGTVKRARRGFPKNLGKSLEPAYDHDSSMHKAVEALGLDLPHDAYGWQLASHWTR